MVSKVQAGLELHIKLLHSTEADSGAIADRHEEFTSFLQSIGAHIQHPHIQKYSDLNRDEFVRAEVDYLRRFIRELDQREKSTRNILLINDDPYVPTFTFDELLEKMRQSVRDGSPNQFSEVHRSTLRRFLDPVQYYGKQIAELYFPEERTEAQTDSQTEGEDDKESEDETARSLLRMKSQVIADRLAGFDGQRKQVLATAILKVKACLKERPWALTDPTGGGFEDAAARGTTEVAIELISVKPKDICLVYHGKSGRKAMLEIGNTNARLQEYAASTGLPRVDRASVSVVFVDDRGALLGSAYAAATNADDPIGRLAVLIKSLELTSEFMTLVARADAKGAAPDEESDSEARLLDLAEEL